MAGEKLTKAQAGKLGGLAAARALGADGVRLRGSKGGETVVERYGRGHMVRLAHKRLGRLGGPKGKTKGSPSPASPSSSDPSDE